MEKLKAAEVLQIIKYIPEGEFITSMYYHGDCMCATAWIGLFVEGDEEAIMDTNRRIMDNPVKYFCQNAVHEFCGTHMQTINDEQGWFNKKALKSYIEPTPKKRIVALLNDMIAAGY